MAIKKLAPLVPAGFTQHISTFGAKPTYAFPTAKKTLGVPPTTTPTPPSSTGGGTTSTVVPDTEYTPPTGGAAPDVDSLEAYMARLRNHPLGIQAAAARQAAENRATANLREQLRAAIVGSGYGREDLSDLGAYGDYVDNAAWATAASNPTSQKALLAAQVTKAQNQLDYQLAARGSGSAGRGGSLEYGLGNIKDQAALARSQQLGSLTDALRGDWTTYGGAFAQAGTDYNAALERVATLLAGQGNPPADTGPGSEHPPHWDEPIPQPGEPVPSWLPAPTGSVVAPSAGGKTVTIGGVPIQYPTVTSQAVPTVPGAKTKKKKPYDPLSSIFGRR